MRILIAPDSFGDTLTAVQAAAAITAGWTQSRPGDDLVSVPQSDGGPGFVDVLAGRLGQRRQTRVRGPLDDDVTAEWVLDSHTAYLECAQACGLSVLGGPPTPQTALAAHSGGVGQLVAAALDAGATRIVVGLGGSACTDGGRGLVDALGGLVSARHRLEGVELIAACDVEYPLSDAAQVFGPQKGADPATVATLEDRLEEWAVELDVAAARPVSAEPGAGAAGGIGAALLTLGGRCESGASIIAEHTGLADDLAEADVLITGEGKFDAQSLRGKVVGALTAAARSSQVDVVVLAGQVALEASAVRAAGIRGAYAVSDHAGSVPLALADASNQLMGLAAKVAAQLGNSGATRYL